MNIHQITFSPTGGTRRVSELLCKGITDKSHTTELCTKEKDFIPPSIATDDLAVISMPVYAGRVPALAVERLKKIKSSGAKCIIIAVYGNRAYEDALVEMQDIATETGFQVVAAVAAIAEHSICREYATGRPDDADARELASLGVAIFEKIRRNTHFKSLTLPPSLQARLYWAFPNSQRTLHQLRNLRKTMPNGRHFHRQPPEKQHSAMHWLHALRLSMSQWSKKYWRTSRATGNTSPASLLREKK